MISQYYSVIADVSGTPEAGRVVLGELGRCRFCDRTTSRRFCKDAHTFLEAMGNKTVFSRDECAECNEIFGGYESHLCASVGVLLTLGGTPGKRNKVRKTGNSKAPMRIRHEAGEHRRISFDMNLENRPTGTSITFFGDKATSIRIPAPLEPFRPRQAYKALIKMGLAILPEDELSHFKRLLKWIQDPADSEEFPFLDVGFSLASVGNAPRTVRGTLLRRRSDEESVPYMIFLFCAGSACWQLDLMPDVKDDHLPPLQFGWSNIRWTSHLGAADTETSLVLDYGLPRHFDWSSNELQPGPIEWIDTHHDWLTGEGRIVPHFRAGFGS